MIATFVSVVAIAASYSLWTAALLLSFCVPIVVVAMRNGKKQYGTAASHVGSLLRHKYIFDVMISGRECADERALFGYLDHYIGRFEHFFKIGRKDFLSSMLKRQIDSKTIGLFMGLLLGLVFVTLLSPVDSGVMSAGAMIALVQAIVTMTNSMGNNLNYLIYDIANNHEYFKDFTTFVNLEETPGATDTPQRGQSLQTLEFRNVSFRYPGSEAYILKGISFVIENGRHYSFVGVNGAGKTTISKLITGLYDNYEGEIFINGQELRGISADRLKGFTACVFQDFAKYQITLGDNIGVGVAGMDDIAERIDEAVDAVGLREVVAQMPYGLEQHLGKLYDDGQDVSGGHWQRIALARAVASPAPLRIPDEPTAALDPISESRVYEQFERISRGMTTIFISHRLGSTKLADEIFVIDDGAVAERGSHDALMAQSGVYAQMFESQRSWYQ